MFKITATMKKLVFLLAAAASMGAHAAGMAQPSDYGAAVAAQNAGKTIVLTASTKWVNVNDGDTVTFVRDGKMFTWHVDTLRGADDFKLSAIAPKDLMADNVEVYVASNPLYRN